MVCTAVQAQAPSASADSDGLMSFLPLVLMFAVLYFIMIRPVMKRQKEIKDNNYEAYKMRHNLSGKLKCFKCDSTQIGITHGRNNS